MIKRKFCKNNLVIAIIIFLLCILINYSKVIFFNEVMLPADNLKREYPWKAVLNNTETLSRYSLSDVISAFPIKKFIADKLHQGVFPIWCNDISCGYPLFANFYLYRITTLLSYFLDVITAHNLSLIFQVFLGMLGMYLLLQEWELTFLPSVFAGVIFALSFPVQEFLLFEMFSGTILFFPFILAFLEKYFRKEHKKYLAISVIFICLAIFNGSLQSMLYLFLGIISFIFFKVRHLYKNNQKNKIKFIVVGGIIALALGVCVSAISVLPTIEFYLFHNSFKRFIVSDWFQFIFIRPLIIVPITIIGTIFPGFLGTTQSIDFKSIVIGLFGDFGFKTNRYSISEWSAYVGLVPIILAIYALIKERSNIIVKFSLFFLISLFFLMIVSPLYLYTYGRGLGLISFALSILAAIGLQQLITRVHQREIKFRKLFKLSLLISLALLIITSLVTLYKPIIFNFMLSKMIATIQSGTYKGFFGEDLNFQRSKLNFFIDNYSFYSISIIKFLMILWSAILTIYLFYKKKVSKNTFIIILFVISTADIMDLSNKLIPYSSRNLVFPYTPLIEFLQKQPDQFRVINYDNSIGRPNELLSYKIQHARVYESLIPPEPIVKNTGSFACQQANVKYLLAPPYAIENVEKRNYQNVYNGPDGKVFEINYSLPRAFIILSNDSEAVADKIKQITSKSTEEILRMPIYYPKIVYYKNSDSIISFPKGKEGILFFLDRNYPGWIANSNSGEKKIYSAFQIMRAVKIHTDDDYVEFRFKPKIIYVGASITFLSILLLVILLINKNKN